MLGSEFVAFSSISGKLWCKRVASHHYQAIRANILRRNLVLATLNQTDGRREIEMERTQRAHQNQQTSVTSQSRHVPLLRG